MKKFAFRLDSVLRYRIAQRELELARMSTLIAEQAKLIGELESLAAQRTEAITSLQLAREFQAIELRSLSSYLVGAAGREQLLQQKLTRQKQLIAAQRERVITAERDVKLLEKLRADRLKDWQKEFDRHTESAAEDAWRAAHQ